MKIIITIDVIEDKDKQIDNVIPKELIGLATELLNNIQKPVKEKIVKPNNSKKENKK